MFDCRLNDNTNVQVELYWKNTTGGRFQEVNPLTDQFVTQSGQNFTVILPEGDNKKYQCRAIRMQGGQSVLEKEIILNTAQGLKPH